MSFTSNIAAPPKRRWYQYSLRTLLIVVTLLAIPCGYVGWQAKFVRERAEVLAWLEKRKDVPFDAESGTHYAVIQDRDNRWSVNFHDEKLSWLRKLLGDHFVEGVRRPESATPEEVNRVKAAFPEAKVTSWFFDPA